MTKICLDRGKKCLKLLIIKSQLSLVKSANITTFKVLNRQL